MKFGAHFASAALVLILAGCGPATSTNPITNTKTSKRDPHLEGVWLYKSGDKKTFIHITLRKENQFRILCDSETKSDMEKTMFDASCSEAGNRKFLNVRTRKADESGVENLTDGYVLFWYEVSEKGVMKLRLAKDDGFAMAIDAGKLKGEVARDKKKKVSNVKVTDSSERLAAYLANSNLDDDFGDTVEFRKLDEPDDEK